MENSVHIFLSRAPFIKILAPLILGIAWQLAFGFTLWWLLLVSGISIISILVFTFLPAYFKFRFNWLKTLLFQISWFCAGALLFVVKDVRFKKDWIGHQYTPGEILVVALSENPVEKENSFKAEASVTSKLSSNGAVKATGKIIIYFRKDSSILQMGTGQKLTFRKALQEIINSGNPGSFDYKRYSLFNDITHQVYLTESDFIPSSEKSTTSLASILQSIRTYVLQTIQKNIPGKKEQGLAEALLIGYKNDLDRELLQAYTNTGIVHVIAVSGMHLALIFWLLNIAFKPLLKSRKTKWLHPLLVIAVMWVFTLIAGGAASIVRAAVMFTFIMVGKSLNRNASIYNALAASAFFLLCYNPYWLWDVGFQLSYAAVLSIIIFYKPLYNMIYVKNKVLDWVWQLLAVSTAAQILTTPIAILHFHQFPVYFLITNLLVVPVSSFVLIGELILVLISPIATIAAFLGRLLSSVIWWMNSFIERLSEFPFSVWEGLQVNLLQVILLYLIIAAMAVWLMEKKTTGLWVSTVALVAFFAIRAFSFNTAQQQRKIIVYNVYRHDAISFIDGRGHKLLSDSGLRYNKRLFAMAIKPTTTLFRLQSVDSLTGLRIKKNTALFHNKKILHINTAVAFQDPANNIHADIVVLSGNPRLYISDLLKTVTPGKIVISSSVPSWKAAYWKKDCDSLNIPYHSVAENGAFVMTLR